MCPEDRKAPRFRFLRRAQPRPGGRGNSEGPGRDLRRRHRAALPLPSGPQNIVQWCDLALPAVLAPRGKDPNSRSGVARTGSALCRPCTQLSGAGPGRGARGVSGRPRVHGNCSWASPRWEGTRGPEPVRLCPVRQPRSSGPARSWGSGLPAGQHSQSRFLILLSGLCAACGRGLPGPAGQGRGLETPEGRGS